MNQTKIESEVESFGQYLMEKSEADLADFISCEECRNAERCFEVRDSVDCQNFDWA